MDMKKYQNIKLKYILTAFFFCWVLALNAQQIQNSWMTSAGSPGWDVLTDITIKPGGNISLLGAYYDSISFNGKKLYSEGSRDLFLATYNSKGNFQNAFSFGGIGFDYPIKLKSSGQQNLVVAFKHNQSVKISGKVVSGEYLNTYSIAWINEKNALSNIFNIGASGKSSLTDLAIANDSSIWVTGWFEDTLHIAGDIFISKSKEDIYLARFTKEGSLQWFNQFGGEGSDKAQILCAGSDNAMFVSGITSNGCFGKMFAPDKAGKSGDFLFLAEVSPLGTIRKVSYPASGLDLIPSGIVHTDSATWIAASFSGTAMVNNGSVECKGKRNILLLWSKKSGSYWDFQHWGGNMVDIPISFIKYRNGLILTGLFSSNADYSGNELKASGSGTDIFMLTILPTGKIDKTFALKGKGFNFPAAVAIQGPLVYVAGEFSDSLENGAGYLKSLGKEDVFLAQYVNCYLTKEIGVDVVTTQLGGSTYYDLNAEKGFESYRWNNSESTTPYYSTTREGTYKIDVTDTLGCPYSRLVKVDMANNTQPDNKAKLIKKFRIYPTMTSNTVYWEPDASWDLSTPIIVSIFNSVGSEVSSSSLTLSSIGSNTLNFSNFANGVYFVKIAGSNFEQESKIIVRK